MEENSKKDLKIIALREALRDRVAEITTTYEDRIVDLRIQITEQSQAIEELNKQLLAVQDALAKYREAEANVPEEADASSA